MESLWTIVSLQDSTRESELLELLCTLTVPKLKLRCKENATKSSRNKADMISFKYCVVMKKILGNWLCLLCLQHHLQKNGVETPDRQDIESGGLTAP